MLITFFNIHQTCREIKSRLPSIERRENKRNTLRGEDAHWIYNADLYVFRYSQYTFFSSLVSKYTEWCGYITRKLLSTQMTNPPIPFCFGGRAQGLFRGVGTFILISIPKQDTFLNSVWKMEKTHTHKKTRKVTTTREKNRQGRSEPTLTNYPISLKT